MESQSCYWTTFTVLVGDANGVDRAVQTFLHEKAYGAVVVYHGGDSPRNNVGKWSCKSVGTESARRDFQFYAAKDLEMAREATYGLSIWDGSSRGTMSNMKNLLNEKKPVLLYLYPHKKFYALKSTRSLMALVGKATAKHAPVTGTAKKALLTQKVRSQQLALREDATDYSV
ncbi:MAG: hypothetical protein HY671_02980 [Chloroflexi bacterium]|nr:hypothetical protein [Chloroflexota bacterium]